ncbi:mitochondrial 54S ribosomal mL50 protein [Aspergillus lucknowensis]|uniref:Large ribosomal subunit protein mL50 n=1 Tax=Aspergillus lucknowensis TaxID=176173 RepID=A0ABR4LBN5_9EURO
MRTSLRQVNLDVIRLQGSRFLYVCSVCRQEARPRPFVARQFLRNASDATPITERVRRKLWGTDNPPGLKDPYGGEGVFEKKFKRGQSAPQEDESAEVTRAAGTENAVVEDALPEETPYEPATTWEGLQRVGHLGRWSDLPPSEADAYNSFSSNRRLTKLGHVSLAAHQTAVELCLMHLLKKPLTSICDVAEHEKPVFKLIWNCKIQPKSNTEWDSALVYPDKETEDALIYIFEQIGGAQQAAPEANAAAEDAEAAELEDTQDRDSAQEPRSIPFFGYKYAKDRGFLALSLNDPVTKFAFLKRFSQLTGQYFPDPILHSISSVGQVIDHIKTELKPKPKKLADHLVGDDSLQSLPNVKVFVKKQKPWHKDEELGRKKLIDAELRERGLVE